MTTSIRSGVDWFDLEGQVDFDGVEAPLPDLLAALRQGERYIKLGDGSRGLLPQAWLEQFAPLADLAPKREGDALRFQPGQALLLDSLLAARRENVSLQVDRQFGALRKRLRSFSGVKPAAAPRVFKGELREYQKEGLGWLRFLEKFGFGGCLADDMGLGKTIQVLAALADRNRRQPKDAERRPSLVVAPKSVVPNWLLEAEKFAPRLAVADYTGIDRHERIEDYNDYDVVLTTYGTLRQDIEWLGETEWDYAILDEAQAIKNAASQSAKASRLINARHRLALSGTPVENHLGELWSIFEFLNPGMLGKSKSLRALSRGASEGDDARIESLRKGLAPFLLRRTKDQVLPQLPKKTEQRLTCELPPAQRKHYNQLRDHYRSALAQRIAKSGIAKSKIHVLEALLRLRQAACHPGLIDKRMKSKPSAKLNLLVEQLTEVLDEGHKALVFSQFTTMLDIVKTRLDKAGIAYEYLDGKTNNRQERIDRFQSDESCPVFLISLKAGGTGLNLTAADFVYLLDPWWNPAVESQAIDRVHRLGQTKPVFAYRLIAKDTVEEKILELQAKKSDLANAIISGDGSLLKSLSADDLQSLLS
jgi:SNF2 family DNA or RNA helicase